MECTSSIGPHSCSADEIVLFQALAFDDLLSDYIPSTEQNLGPIISRQLAQSMDDSVCYSPLL